MDLFGSLFVQNIARLNFVDASRVSVYMNHLDDMIPNSIEDASASSWLHVQTLREAARRGPWNLKTVLRALANGNWNAVVGTKVPTVSKQWDPTDT